MSNSEPMDKRIGVFGGSFDPVQNGHLQVAEAVSRQRDLDRVVFVPALLQPIKSERPLAPGEHRLAMIRLAIHDAPAFEVSDTELRRPGKSFTIDTIQEFRRKLGPRPELFFIIGSDSVAELPRWKNVEKLADLCSIIVAARPGWPLDALDALAARLPPDRVETMKSLAVRTTKNTVSSTEVRKRLAAGESVEHLVPKAVADYIARNKLYSSA